MLKAVSVDRVIEWVESKKDSLIQIETMPEKVFNEMVRSKGIAFAELVRVSPPANMYLSCKVKILQVRSTINSKGVLYPDFETTLPYYKEKGILVGDEPEIEEFNDIIIFCI